VPDAPAARSAHGLVIPAGRPGAQSMSQFGVSELAELVDHVDGPTSHVAHASTFVYD
jgi:hypothetical protein